MGNSTLAYRRPPPTPSPTDRMIELLEAIYREQVATRRMLDEFLGVYLNAKFQFGKPGDRWSRRRG